MTAVVSSKFEEKCNATDIILRYFKEFRRRTRTRTTLDLLEQHMQLAVGVCQRESWSHLVP